MITASKAFIAFCLLALVGTALVIGPTELRRLLPDGTKVTVAAKPEAKVERIVGMKTDPVSVVVDVNGGRLGQGTSLSQPEQQAVCRAIRSRLTPVKGERRAGSSRIALSSLGTFWLHTAAPVSLTAVIQ